LIDTHVLIWWLDGGNRLSSQVRNVFRDPDSTILVSAASAWEIAIKSAAGKMDAGPLIDSFENEIEQEGFVELPILARHAVRAGLLSGPNKDPFDRMLAAQALTENVPLISRDTHFDSYAVRRIW
jgi:PIN domain nuclease of toxin-antitoxin system